MWGMNHPTLKSMVLVGAIAVIGLMGKTVRVSASEGAEIVYAASGEGAYFVKVFCGERHQELPVDHLAERMSDCRLAGNHIYYQEVEKGAIGEVAQVGEDDLRFFDEINAIRI